MHQTRYPFVLPSLSCPDTLHPGLTSETLYFHHSKHFSVHVETLNDLLSSYPAYQRWTLEQLCLHWHTLPEKIRQGVRSSAGGIYNHDLYFKVLQPSSGRSPGAILLNAVYRDYGSLTQLKSAMRDSALRHPGSGWVWLVTDKTGRLSVTCTANQDIPVSSLPLLCCDLWEHAYYLQYQNRRDIYFEAWWTLINWPLLSRWYAAFIGR